MKQADKNVLFIVEEGDIARPYYRAILPAEGIRSFGWNVRLANVLYETEKHRFNGWSWNQTGEFRSPKIIILHAMLSPKKGTKPGDPIELVWETQKDLIEQARNEGQVVFFDLDDDIWNIPPWNPQYQNLDTGTYAGLSLVNHRTMYVADVNASNGLIVSTDSIAESAKDNGVNVPIYVCPNSVRLPPYVEREIHEPYRVGWAGDLAYREYDLREFLAEMQPLAFIHTEFWHLGANFDKKSVRDVLKEYPHWKHEIVVERPWVSVTKFNELLHQIDTLLIPNIWCPFNNGRSYVQGLECMAAGTPFSADMTIEYQKLMREIECGWGFQELFYSDLRYRKEWIDVAREVISDRHLPRHAARHYFRAFEEHF